MGGILGIVFPDGGCLGIQARNIQLQHGGQQLAADILHDDITGQASHDATQIQLIAHANDGTGIGIGHGGRDLIDLPQLLHQQRCGNIRVQAAAHLGQVLLKIALPGGIVVTEGVFKGGFLADREMIVVLHIHLPAQLHQLHEVIVGAGGGQDHIVVKHQVIAGTVGNQHIAVAVQDLTPGRLDTGDRGKIFGVIHLAAGLHDLQIIELDGKKAN